MKFILILILLCLQCSQRPVLEHRRSFSQGKKILIGTIESRVVRGNPHLGKNFIERLKFELTDIGFQVEECESILDNSTDPIASYFQNYYPVYFPRAALEINESLTKKKNLSDYKFDYYLQGSISAYRKWDLDSDSIEISLFLEYFDKEGNPIGRMVHSGEMKSTILSEYWSELAKQTGLHIKQTISKEKI